MSDNKNYSVDDIIRDSKNITFDNSLESLFIRQSDTEDGFFVDLDDTGSESVFDAVEREEKPASDKATGNDNVREYIKETETPTAETEDVVKTEVKNEDFSFEKMYEKKKTQKDEISKTRVFTKETPDAGDHNSLKLTEKESSSEEDEMERELKEKRKEKIDKFRLFAENLGGDSYGEEPQSSIRMSDMVKPEAGTDIFEVIEKTDKPKKENSKRREKKKMRDSKVYDKIDVGRVKLYLDKASRDIKIRKFIMIASFVLCLVLGVMKTLYVNGKLDALSTFMGRMPIAVYAAEFLLGFIPFIAAFKAFIGRLKDSERPSLNSEAMVCVVFLFNALHNAVLIVKNPVMGKDVMLFGTAACFIGMLQVSAEGKQNLMIRKNLEALVRNERMMGIFSLENESEKLASGISKAKEPMILCAGEVEIPNSFLDSSMTKDKENTFYNITVPLSLLLSAACGAIAYFSYGSVIALSSAVISALLVSAPVFITPVLIALISDTNESLNRTGCEILGYEDVENIDETDAIVLDTADIFTGSLSHFHLISRKVKIDTLHAFEIACSVLYESGGVLKKEISEFIKEQKLILPKVEDIKYEEKLGISCWVEDKCVLVGTEKMMREHNIEISPEYSGRKYEKEGSQVFYLAIDSHAMAMFCADYFIGRQAKKQLVELYKTGVILMLMTTDPHIDEQFVANTLGVSDSSIKTVSPVGAAKIRESIGKTTKQKRTGLIFKKSVVGLLKVINASFRLYDVQSLAILIQIVSMVFAIVVSGVLSAVATGYLPGAIFIIAYHIIWTCLGRFVTHKNKK